MLSESDEGDSKTDFSTDYPADIFDLSKLKFFNSPLRN